MLNQETWSHCVRTILFDRALDAVPFAELLSGILPFDASSKIPPGSKVLVRADLDVPLDATRSNVEDTERLLSLSQTVELCKALRLVPVLYGHVGRDKENSARPLVAELERAFGLQCVFVPEWLDDATGSMPLEAVEQIQRTEPGAIVLLEQTRRYDLERQLWGKKPDSPDLMTEVMFRAASSLARNISTSFIFDALASHNPDWSSVVVPGGMQNCYLGPYAYSELAGPLRDTRHSEILLLSGLKIDKLDALEAVVERAAARVILCGGSLAMALVKALGRPIGQAEAESNSTKKWYISPERTEQASRIIGTAKRNGVDLVVPLDFILDDGTISEDIPESKTQRDIGPRSIQLFVEKITKYVSSKESDTVIFYNGSVGQFEEPKFSTGTRTIVESLCDLARRDRRAKIYVGGGDGRLTFTRFGDPSLAAHVFTCGGTVLKVIGSGNLNYLKSLHVYRNGTGS